MSGPQQIEVGYENLAELDGFAWDWGKAQDGVVIDVNRLVGFCFLIGREVIDAIGMLDEQFGIGCFEDDDYCLRAIAAGYRAVIAGDAFVHHFGSRTFLGSGVDGARAHARERAPVSGEVGGQRHGPPLTRPSADLSHEGRGGDGAAARGGGAVRSRHRGGGRRLGLGPSPGLRPPSPRWRGEG